MLTNGLDRRLRRVLIRFTCSDSLKGSTSMTRYPTMLSIGLIAVFGLMSFCQEAEARQFRNRGWFGSSGYSNGYNYGNGYYRHYGNRGNYGYGNTGYYSNPGYFSNSNPGYYSNQNYYVNPGYQTNQQYDNTYGSSQGCCNSSSQQQVVYAPAVTTACCTPQPVCCDGNAVSGTTLAPVNATAPQPPTVSIVTPAPIAGN